MTESGVIEKTALVFGQMNEPPGARMRVALTGLTMAEYFRDEQNQDVLLEVAQRLLFMPDLFSYYLTGVANNEYCIASTSELLDAHQRNWSMDTMFVVVHRVVRM